MSLRNGKDSLPSDSLRIAFLGDSITDNGLYIAYMDAYFLQHQPTRDITLINLGVSSETASGLSEPDHPFPRPCLHDRLESALEKSRPDRVVLCYGMNDGIYHPFADERFQAYKDGMTKAIQAVKQAGAQAVVLTPPPYDAEADQTATEPDSTYSWKNPYTGYSQVLRRYADWIMTLSDEAEAVIDIYDPLLQLITDARRNKEAPISSDGIHPNGKGHWVIARTVMNGLLGMDMGPMPPYVTDTEPPAWFALTLRRHRLLSSAWKEHVGHTNPNKAQALPLETALAQGEEQARQIRGMLQGIANG